MASRLVETIGRGSYGTVRVMSSYTFACMYAWCLDINSLVYCWHYSRLQVHKAINLSSGAAVAVKLIGKDKLRRPHERQSIEKEIETMRVAVEQYENGHPHIVRLLCTKESQHHIFIVLVRINCCLCRVAMGEKKGCV